MKEYIKPTVTLLYLAQEDILTISDPTGDDLDWDEISL